MSFNMLPEVDSKGLKNYPCFSGEGRHLIVGVAGAFEKSSNEMFNSIWRMIRDNEVLNPAMTTCGSMIDSVNIVSVDSSATMTGWKNTCSNDLNYPITFIGDVNGEFTRKMGMSTVFADGSTRSWFYFAMVSDGFFDVWTPAKGFRDGTEVDSHSYSNSDATYNASRRFHNEVRDFIDELIEEIEDDLKSIDELVEEEEFKSVAGK